MDIDACEDKINFRVNLYQVHWVRAASKKILAFVNKTSASLEIKRAQLWASQKSERSTEFTCEAKRLHYKIVKMRLFFQACFIAMFLVLSVNGDKSSPSCAKPYDKMMACNLICNMIQDSDANNAMKMLQTKLESLIAVIKKPSPPLPGKLLIFWHCFPVAFELTHFD